LYLRLPGDDSDAVFTPLKPLIADERSDVNRYFHTAIFPGFHRKQLAREREQTIREKFQIERERERERERKSDSSPGKINCRGNPFSLSKNSYD